MVFLGAYELACSDFVLMSVQACICAGICPEDDIAFLHDPSEIYQTLKFQHSILSSV